MSRNLDAAALREAYATFKETYGDAGGRAWRERYLAWLEVVRSASVQVWMQPQFQRRLWEDDSISGVGPGSTVTVVGAYEDEELARYLLTLREDGMPAEADPAHALQSAYDDVLTLVRPRYTERRPRARIARLLAALYPQHMSCLVDKRRTLQVHGLVGAQKVSTEWIGQNAAIRARLREALQDEGSDEVDHAMFCWFLWESNFATRESGAGVEVIGVGREAVAVPEFSLLPASSQRRSLFAVKNNIGLLVSVVRECEQGISKEDLVDFIQQEAPGLAESSAGHVINQALGGGLGLIRFENGAYYPTDRGLELLTAQEPGQVLRAPIVGRVFGVGHLLRELQRTGGMAQQDAARYLQSLVPTWTTTMPGSYVVLWAKLTGLVSAELQDGRTWLTLTDDGDDYASALPADFEERWVIEDEEAEEPSVEGAAPAAPAVARGPSTPYGVGDIVADGCFIPQPELEAMLDLLRRKKNLVLQGPPGTGKTWLARRLGYALVGAKGPSKVTAVQFQPSLSYEDFVRGWRPQAGKDGVGGLRLTDGVFLERVAAAAAEPDEDFVLVIEEINRGNPAQILGELLTLLEADKRSPEEALRVAYPRHSEERIYIPPNLYVIGTMNIADRSLALVDLALRRRFAFRNLTPQLNGAWRKWCLDAGAPGPLVDLIAARIGELNATISADSRLGEQFCVGHSFVTPANGVVADWANWFSTVVETEIGPLLAEYWYDDPETARQQQAKLA